jgi:hypothetical protein
MAVEIAISLCACRSSASIFEQMADYNKIWYENYVNTVQRNAIFQISYSA